MYHKLTLEVCKQSANKLNELQIMSPKKRLYYLQRRPRPYPIFLLLL
jgi:hypothetical protein